MRHVRITCTEKQYLGNQTFSFNFPVNYTEFEKLTQQQFYDQVKNQHVLIVNDLKVDLQVMDNNPDLQLIALCSTGFDHVDIGLAKQRNIKVCNIKGYAGDTVAEHAFLLMLNLVRNFQFYHNSVVSGLWSDSSCFCYQDHRFPIYDLKDKILVIVGRGEIGQSLAAKAQAFGMKVFFSERPNQEGCREGYVTFHKALQIADVLSLHCSLNDENRHMLNQETFNLMKPSSFIINVSRGGLVNEHDLLIALQSGRIAGYGADAMTYEPPPKKHPLLNSGLHNVLLTPHIAWSSEEAKQHLFKILIQNIEFNLKDVDINRIV
ncbi:D-2-hydroxyacid dehydrogenase [Acinetobacter lactucae]|uniref:D-2-hydroxyacid dehydrogenase n=1 Tax=Acinetobacter lactucae TaxID=1785128 RepID=A0A3R9RG01_9GAMM|nr:D-2-hydroxyacid dehydrogenase [Acinetobacter lactucae]RSO58837.1 D-2-hydroxyacid dehydrogenase [Acinetobacter lactucae]